jgi:hypothetical protein
MNGTFRATRKFFSHYTEQHLMRHRFSITKR